MTETKNFKVLVCGGREYGWKTFSNGKKDINQAEVAFLGSKLNLILQSTRELSMNLIIIQGEASGADSWAKAWAKSVGIEVESYPADWKTHGKSAGFIRNSQMLKEGKPDLVVAFPGGNGTKMMCDIAEKAGVKVRRYMNAVI
jgi:hypothetical protein